ncbi:MAG: hypothetical protein D6729_09135 [Deltaproteobacteria bacterium]|nr:MAG: hypothetical protein D6729_09135 [Deltaproteobacteria bacterium]
MHRTPDQTGPKWRARRALPIVGALLALSMVACPEPDSGGRRDGGGGGGSDGATGTCLFDSDCPSGTVCNGGVCEAPSVCMRDSDCGPGETCNVLTGACESAGGPDGGSDGGSPADGGSEDGGPMGICTPGTVQCNSDATGLATCSDDGSQWIETPCADSTPVCVAGACAACAPGTTRCNGNAVETCAADGSGWGSPSDCGAGTCIEGTCQLCSPGEARCADQNTREVCNATGTAWQTEPCGANATCDGNLGECVAFSCTPGTRICNGEAVEECNASGTGYDPVEDCAAQAATCRQGACVSLCDEAVNTRSYIGCEYWPVALSNTQIDPIFHDDYALVIGNPHLGTTAQITVEDASGSTVASASIPGGNLQELRLPWNALPAVDANGRSQTQKGATAYRLTSTVPVTVYQFNPILSADGGTFSYSNDASLLLPAHILGDPAASPASTYLAMTVPHMSLHRECSDGQQVDFDLPSFVTIVATAPGTTQVTIVARGAIAPGGSLPSQIAPGQQVTVSLAQFEVLQLASDRYGTPAAQTFTRPLSCGFFNLETLTDTHTEYPGSDLTGTIITSDKPVAVYAGSDCRLLPYDKWACDHMEQQMPPFATWGNHYVAARTQPPPGGNTAVGDLWRIVAAADGTVLSFSPPSVHANVTLNAGEWVELQTAMDFVVQSQDIDHPILVGQFMVGQDATGSTMGDPTMILAAPTAQYKRRYSFVTPSTIAQDYVNVVRPTGATILLDGSPVNTTWIQAGSSSYEVGRVSVTDGTHSISSDQPFGVTVYGYDEYVSYGYPAGLDLQSIVVINPGG